MKRPEEYKKSKKRILLLLASLVITAVFAGSVVFSIKAMGEALPETSVDRVNEERSQLLVSGKNYSLDKEQEELYSNELEREEQKREEQKEEQKENTDPEEAVESIITEEKPEVTETAQQPEEKTETPTPEPTNTETPTPEPTDTPTPSPDPSETPAPTPTPTKTPTPTPTVSPSDTPTPEPTETSTPSPTITPTATPEPTDNPTPEPSVTVTPSPDDDDEGDGGDGGDPGDDGTPVPTSGPDGGDGDDEEGEGDEGENPTPTPTEVPEEVTTDPVIECSLSDGEYAPNLSFTLRGIDYHNRVIESFYYTVWYDGIQFYSSGTDGSGYATYRPEGQVDTSDGDHEITVTVTDTEGHSSSKTYIVHLQAEEMVLTEEYVSVTVDAGSIYTSGSFVLVSDMVQIYPDENVSSLVDRVLRMWGYDPQASYDWRGYKLARIARAAMIDIGLVKEEYRDMVYTTDSLGERDISNFSGWLYMVNGVYMDVGMSGVTLTDGDEVYIWFSLNPQDDPLCTW